MSRKKGTGTGTRNLNGMGNLYINKATGRIEYRIMQNGRLRVASGTSAKVVNERKKLLTGVTKVKQKVNRLFICLQPSKAVIKPATSFYFLLASLFY